MYKRQVLILVNVGFLAVRSGHITVRTLGNSGVVDRLIVHIAVDFCLESDSYRLTGSKMCIRDRSVSGDNMMVALTMTFASEPMAKTMSFQREYAEAYDWVCLLYTSRCV